MDTVVLSEIVHRQATWLASHSDRVVTVATSLGRQLNLNELQLERLAGAARLHDVGKIRVRADIVNKPGPLDPTEWREMQRHPVHGYWLLYRVAHQEIAETVLCHHERYDGTGYPFGLSGTAIPLLSRVLAVADAHDAMTSDRPYRLGIDGATARYELAANAGTQFDPQVVEAMLDLIDERPLADVAYAI